MQDAFNLGWKLSLAAAGRASAGLLDSYHAERHAVAARVIELTTRMTDMGTLEHGLARRLRNHALHLSTGLAPIAHRVADMTEEIDISARSSPIVAGHAGHRDGVHPGDAAPDVSDTGLQRILAGGTDHVALYLAPNGIPERIAADEVSRHVLVAGDGADGPGFDEVISDPEGRIAARYSVRAEGALFLVRPDGYVGLRARFGDTTTLADYQQRVFG